MVVVALIACAVACVFWTGRPRRAREAGFRFVYVNQDGSVREVSRKEQEQLLEKHAGGDGARPYVKWSYGSSDGWGSRSGFIGRRRIPPGITILPVHPYFDAAIRELGEDPLGHHRAAGDIIARNAGGSITCTPSPDIPAKKRFELARGYQLEQQRRREALARV
jgi:hypothetical protein